jgi:hypothetical protein
VSETGYGRSTPKGTKKMSTTVTPRYRIEYWDQTGKHLCAWNEGAPTAEKAENWRREMNVSFQPGGVNGHVVGMPGGFTLHVNRVHVVRQSDDWIVASARMPMFEVV